MTAQPMTAAEARKAARELELSTSPKAYVSIRLNRDVMYGEEGALTGTLYPNGIGNGDERLHISADTFEEVIEGLRLAYATHAAAFALARIRQMALVVIQLTDECGACTDAQLRLSGFTWEEVLNLGDAACARADEMAGKGPFAINVLGDGNGAPVEPSGFERTGRA